MTPRAPGPLTQGVEEFVICLAQALDDLDHAAPEDRSADLMTRLLLDRAFQATQFHQEGTRGIVAHRLARAVERNLDQLRNSRQKP